MLSTRRGAVGKRSFIRGCYKMEGNSWKGGNSTAEERSGETNNDLEGGGEGFGKVGKSGKVGEKKLRKKKIYYLDFGKFDEQKDTKN